MNDTNNLISEELGKMTQLFNYQRGKVISEQASSVATDVGAISQELNKFDSDETKIVNIIKKYNNKGSFKDFANQYKTIIGKKFGDDLYRAIRLGDDSKEINDLKKFFSPLGIEFKLSRSGWDFSGIDVETKSPPPAPNNKLTPEATACIKQFGTPKPAASPPGFVYVDLEGGSTLFFGVDNSTQYKPKDKPTIYGKWACKSNVLNIVLDDGDSRSKAQGGWKGTQPEKTTDTASVVGAKVKTGKTQNLSTLTQDVQKSIGGTPSGKFSSQELDSILQSLGGNDVSGEVSQSLPTDTSGKPDLDKILASLSQ